MTARRRLITVVIKGRPPGVRERDLWHLRSLYYNHRHAFPVSHTRLTAALNNNNGGKKKCEEAVSTLRWNDMTLQPDDLTSPRKWSLTLRMPSRHKRRAGRFHPRCKNQIDICNQPDEFNSQAASRATFDERRWRWRAGTDTELHVLFRALSVIVKLQPLPDFSPE